jgi:hypothetical protein
MFWCSQTYSFSLGQISRRRTNGYEVEDQLGSDENRQRPDGDWMYPASVD